MRSLARTLAAAPSLLPAAALLVGVRLGLAAADAPVGPLVALMVLGTALGAPGPARPGAPICRTAGWLVTAAAAGCLVGVAGAERGPVPGPDRPVAAEVVVVGHPLRFHDRPGRGGDTVSAAVRVVRLAWGEPAVPRGRVLRTRPLEAWLRVPAPEEPGDAPRLLRPGRRLRVRGFLRRPQPLGNLPPRPPGPWRLAVKSRLLVEDLGDAGPLRGAVGRLASGLRRRAEAALAAGELGDGDERPSAAAAGRDRSPARMRPLGLPLTRALVLGDPSGVPMAIRRGLRRLGLAHVLAVSGLHVGLVAATALLSTGGLPRRLRLAAALAAVTTYLLLVGPRPSLLRAAAMACLAAAALLSERPPQAANALAVAAAGIALMRPEAVLDLGFRLTVGATAGIVLLGPGLARSWHEAWIHRSAEAPAHDARSGPPKPLTSLARAVAASAGAQIGVLPWALPTFCMLTPWAVVVNLLAVPWTAVTLAGCLVWTGVATVAQEAGRAALPLVDRLAAPFGWPAAVPSRVWISLPVSASPVVAALLVAGLLFGLRRPARRWPVLALLGLVLAGAGSGPADGLAGSGGSAVTAVMLDVGQGDAILLRDGPRAVLVDGGGWPHGDLGGRVLLPSLVYLGVRRLDAMVLTHPDRDHCGGLVDLAGYLEVGEVVTGFGVGESGCGREIDALPGVRVRRAAAGGVWRVGRWRLRVLHPELEVPGGGRLPRRGDNDASLVLMAEAFGRRLLLTGDVEASAERELLRRFPGELEADVLKVAHHGSRTSTSEPFLQAVDPHVAVVSAGARNPYGHPAEEILHRLERHGVHTVRTDRDGMIVLRIDEHGSLFVGTPAGPK